MVLFQSRLCIGLGNVEHFGQSWVVTGQAITPLIHDIFSLDHESAAEPQHSLGYLSKFHIGRDRADLGYIAHVLPRTSETTQIGSSHFDLLGDFLVLFIESPKSHLLVSTESVVIDKCLVSSDEVVEIQECVQLLGISNGNEDGASDALSFQLRLELAPLSCVAPAVRSSHVTKEDNDRSPCSHCFAELNRVALSVCYKVGA